MNFARRGKSFGLNLRLGASSLQNHVPRPAKITWPPLVVWDLRSLKWFCKVLQSLENHLSSVCGLARRLSKRFFKAWENHLASENV